MVALPYFQVEGPFLVQGHCQIHLNLMNEVITTTMLERAFIEINLKYFINSHGRFWRFAPDVCWSIKMSVNEETQNISKVLDCSIPLNNTQRTNIFKKCGDISMKFPPILSMGCFKVNNELLLKTKTYEDLVIYWKCLTKIWINTMDWKTTCIRRCIDLKIPFKQFHLIVQGVNLKYFFKSDSAVLINF